MKEEKAWKKGIYRIEKDTLFLQWSTNKYVKE
jgi:hypothetical protein